MPSIVLRRSVALSSPRTKEADVYKRQCVGGGLGAMYASIVGLGATGTGVTGIFGILLHLHSPINYLITMLIAAGVSFALTWIFGYKNPKPETNAVKGGTDEASEAAVQNPVGTNTAPAANVSQKAA